MKLFTGTTNPDFAQKISEHLNVPISSAKVSKFADGEISVMIGDNVRKENCYIIQPTCINYETHTSVNDSLMELLIMVDALKRGSANNVIAVIPYYGYSRQDRKDYSRAPISAAVVAKCLEASNIDRLIVYDLHAGQIAGFFSNMCPLDNLYAEKYFKIRFGQPASRLRQPHPSKLQASWAACASSPGWPAELANLACKPWLARGA